LFNQAEREGVILYAVSGYRSYQRQADIFARNSAQNPEANRFSAKPGQSEHQTGLAMDLTNSAGVNKQLSQDFGETKEGKWLKEKAWQYGFIIRYPSGKEDLTGYSYEPWHVRYVGKEAAQIIKDKGLVLEEYVAR
jgi:D-alanyl-D-alanine carboxypeptidase